MKNGLDFWEMARRPRIEYPGAIYHVINRGNYRSDVFGSPGAAQTFVTALKETVEMFGWKLGAYAVMRNHFHLAVQTPEPNLAAGMQRLQVTFAVRFNRFRSEQGHLFQGRYRAILLENEEVLARVANYIHLNPVRAGIIAIDQASSFRWSSWASFEKSQQFRGLDPNPWLATMGLADTESGWKEYAKIMRERFGSDDIREEERTELFEGWAVGSVDWKTKLIQERLTDEALKPTAEYVEPKEAMRIRWVLRLEELLAEAHRSRKDLVRARKAAAWKVGIAARLQLELGVSVVWLAEELCMGKPASARVYLHHERKKLRINDMTPFTRIE
jgi:putative transposase